MAFAGYSFHQVTATPRPPVPEGQQENTQEVDAQIGARLFAALTAAHASTSRIEGGALMVAWDRPPGSRRIRVIVGGVPQFPSIQLDKPTLDGELPVAYPPGTVAKPLDANELVDGWEDLPVWLRCTGRPDALWTPGQGQSRIVPRRGGFEDHLAHLPGTFVWLVVAEPLTAEAVDLELADLEVRMPALRLKENSEPARIELARGEGRYREIARAQSAGMWGVHVLIGAPDEAGAYGAAGLLCGAADLDQQPYALRPFSESGSLDTVWNKPIPADRSGFASPFAGTSELLATLARPPRRELPGIRVTEPAQFDVTPEYDGDIPLGSVLDEADAPVAEFSVRLSTLNRHTFVAGATGSGKSQTTRYLLHGLHNAGVPWLVIEPAKAEYARMAGRLGGHVTVIRPGDPNAIPAGLNPLEPEPGFPLQTHIDLIRALFLAAFEAQEPFPQVLAQALTRCYSDLGWDLTLGESKLGGGVVPRYPVLDDLQKVAMQVVEDIGYSREITDNVRGFIDVRIGSLRLGTTGRFFQGDYPIDIGDMLTKNMVLEIEDVGSDSDKAFFIGAIVIRIFEYLRVQNAVETVKGLQHVTVIEEAHRLLKKAEEGSPAAYGVELFAGLLAEIRAYGEGIIVAEQIPAKITPDVVKNTALKFLHRLPAQDDRELVGAAMNLTPQQSRHVVSLPPGRAVVFADGMDHPLRIVVPLGEDNDDPTLADHNVKFTRTNYPLMTLRELNGAQRLSEDPGIVVWLELLAAAHLVGRPSPNPDRPWLTGLVTRYPPELLSAALQVRLRGAVEARYAKLTGYFQPENLTAHLLERAKGFLTGNPHVCDGNETEWHTPDYLEYTDILASSIKKLHHHQDPSEQFLGATEWLNLTTTWPLIAFNILKDDKKDDGK